METRTCPAYGCQGGKTSIGMCLVCKGQGRVRVKQKDPNARPGKCPYHACGDTCQGRGTYDYQGVTIYCWADGPADDTGDVDTGKSIERMEEFMDINKAFRTTMMTVVAEQLDSKLFAQLSDIESRYQALLDTTGPNDIYIQSNINMIHQQLAEIAEWRARALQSAHRANEAIEEFERASELFTQLGKQADAQRCQDKSNDLRLTITGDFDVELERLHSRLENTEPGNLLHAEILLALGELHSNANDDFQAIQFLHEAEEELNTIGNYASDTELLGALTDSVSRIKNGEAVAGASPIENAMRHRALTQRLLLALGNAYRTTDPARAAEYEEKTRNLHSSSTDSNTSELMRQFLEADQDISKFLQNIRKP